MTVYPIPTHLKPFLTPLGEKNSELSVTGVIRCKCGHLLFTPYANEAGTVAAASAAPAGARSCCSTRAGTAGTALSPRRAICMIFRAG